MQPPSPGIEPAPSSLTAQRLSHYATMAGQVILVLIRKCFLCDATYLLQLALINDMPAHFVDCAAGRSVRVFIVRHANLPGLTDDANATRCT